SRIDERDGREIEAKVVRRASLGLASKAQLFNPQTQQLAFQLQRRRLAGFGNMIDPEHRYLPHRRRLPEESERRANSALVMDVSLFVIGGQALMTNGKGNPDRPSTNLGPPAHARAW